VRKGQITTAVEEIRLERLNPSMIPEIPEILRAAR
jgi:hypothetical protein